MNDKEKVIDIKEAQNLQKRLNKMIKYVSPGSPRPANGLDRQADFIECSKKIEQALDEFGLEIFIETEPIQTKMGNQPPIVFTPVAKWGLQGKS